MGSSRRSGRLARRDRLTGSEDFQAVFRQGKRIERPSLIVIWRETGAPPRAGFAVSRQIRGAVARNRARRRLREAYRRAAGPGRGDVVLVARSPALTAPFALVVRDVESGLRAVDGGGRP